MPLGEEYATAFREGVYFAYENITTLPASLEILSEYTARLTLVEGKYHQVKRMLAAVGNKVTKLHRESVGAIELDADLALGEWRYSTEAEIKSVK